MRGEGRGGEGRGGEGRERIVPQKEFKCYRHSEVASGLVYHNLQLHVHVLLSHPDGPLTRGYPGTVKPVPASGSTVYISGAKLKTSLLQPSGRAGAVHLTVRVVLVRFTRVTSRRSDKSIRSGARQSMPVCVCVCVFKILGEKRICGRVLVHFFMSDQKQQVGGLLHFYHLVDDPCQ